MGQTLAEKILSNHAGKNLKAGEIATINVDLAYVQDGTGPLTMRQWQKLGLNKVFDPEKVLFFLDHASPPPRAELANDHKFLREMAVKTGATVSETGNGISHMVTLESYARPGDVIVGADSHTCTNGALGAFATGMGSTDVAVAITLGQTWMMVPATIRVNCSGEWPLGVYGKDLILHLIGLISSRGATYKALEWGGDAISSLPMAGRATIANMAVEAGAKAGLIPPDEVTQAFLRRMGREGDYRELLPDADAEYESVVDIDISSLEPTVARPHYVDNTTAVGNIGDVRVDQVFLGTSCNGRLDDFRIAAKILRGRKVAPGTRLLVTPGSRRVLMEAMDAGIMQTFIDAGGLVTGPGCGACVGVHEGILADDEVCFATQPRNFKGRMGNPQSSIYLGSPAMAAATAVTGRITDPREFASELSR